MMGLISGLSRLPLTVAHSAAAHTPHAPARRNACLALQKVDACWLLLLHCCSICGAAKEQSGAHSVSVSSLRRL